MQICHFKKNVSVGISDRVFTSKLTKGQKNVLNDFFEILNSIEPCIVDFEPQEEHTEEYVRLDFGLELYITDISNIAGYKVQSDGAYLAYNGNLYNVANINKKKGGGCCG